MNLQDIQLPLFIRQLGQKLPAPIANTPFILLLALARKKNWLVAPDHLYGHSFNIVVEDLGLHLYFRCEEGKFKSIHAQNCEVKLTAHAIDYLRLATGVEDADTLFFRRRLKIEGDTELGIAVKYWIDASERPAWLQQLTAKFNAELA
ncbi:ubiquinone anaerobic biosynthesis accessory factor UbiT [Undibacterium fentianense]|uniref:SCP2 sterol-binding domain-containing protein n=1 Tax=Undibacterium fentianense TaxID=2828728 RepID=A0A941IDM2_9BURK|nr:SCP2 sterol-binding domain-containing protein [Undibacterium fentianense]MBR7800133.1 SCP2 sterol-binding domain-containing protein [Undibacterium fentianense]